MIVRVGIQVGGGLRAPSADLLSLTDPLRPGASLWLGRRPAENESIGASGIGQSSVLDHVKFSAEDPKLLRL